MHLSIIPPGPNTSAMLGEGGGDAEALTEGVMHSRSFLPPATLTQWSRQHPRERQADRLTRRRTAQTMLHSEKKAGEESAGLPSLRTPEITVRRPRSPPGRMFRCFHRSKIVCFRW